MPATLRGLPTRAPGRACGSYPCAAPPAGATLASYPGPIPVFDAGCVGAAPVAPARHRTELVLTPHHHAVVWIDHHEARVFHFNADESDASVVHAQHAKSHLHHKANSIGSGHVHEDQAFFHDVVAAIGAAGAVLITGPASAKHELEKHIQRHDPSLVPRIAAVETLDHPTDGALVDHARRYFRAADRMQS